CVRGSAAGGQGAAHLPRVPDAQSRLLQLHGDLAGVRRGVGADLPRPARTAQGLTARAAHPLNSPQQSRERQGESEIMAFKNVSRRAAIATGVAGIAALARPSAPRAQDFPTKPITIVSPFGPGTTNDIIARQLGQDMMGTLGQSVIVDDR